MQFLRATRLESRYRLGQLIKIVGGGGAMFFGLLMGSQDRQAAGVLLAVGVGMTALGFLYNFLAIRCPNCDLRLAWYAYSSVPFGRSMRWLEVLEECPRCGFRPGVSPTHSANSR